MALVVGSGAGYDIASTPPTYLDSAAVIFNLPKSQAAPNAYYSYATSLITSGDAMAKILVSPQTQRQIRAAGGTADVNLALTNLYNKEYPDYGEPLAVLTAASPSPSDARRTFMISARLLDRLLTARQAQASVPPQDRISAQVVGATGPVAQAGSPTRVLAGVALLTLVAITMMWGLIERMILRLNHCREVPRSRRAS